MNSQRAWVATRKGLFELGRKGKGWEIARVSFLAEPVSMMLPPTAGGRMLAALNLGHFGVKVHASDDAGATWHEVGTPAYPPQPPEATGVEWKLVQIWSLEFLAGALWAGTLPGGLFRSGDGGDSWQLVEPLWSRPERAEWFGGGYDVPGIHSVLPHPTRPGELLSSSLDRLDTKAIEGHRRGERSGEFAGRVHGVRIGVDAMDVVSRLQQVREVAAEATAGVEDAIGAADPPAQELIEQVDVDRAETRLEVVSVVRRGHTGSGGLGRDHRTSMLSRAPRPVRKTCVSAGSTRAFWSMSMVGMSM